MTYAGFNRANCLHISSYIFLIRPISQPKPIMAAESAPVDLFSFINSTDINSIDKIYKLLIPALVSQITIAKNSVNLENQNNTTTAESQSSSVSSLHHHKSLLCGQLERLRGDLDDIKESFNELNKFEENINNPFKAVILGVATIVKEITEDPQAASFSNEFVQTEIRNLNKVVNKLKVKVPPADKTTNQYGRSNNGISHAVYNAGSGIVKVPKLNAHDEFKNGDVFKECKLLYEDLEKTAKLCLLCFALFPENEVVKKRVLLYWWIGEGFISTNSSGAETAENAANRVIVELVSKGFIVPVEKKRKLVANSFKMHPLVRSAVNILAEDELFFDYDAEKNLSWVFLSSQRTCLTKGGCSNRLSAHSPDLDQEKLRTLFNVNENYLNLNPEWFLKLRNISVLQLGRWQSSEMHHIEVEDTEFLKKFKNMKHLKFFSLQGISRITELPKSIFSGLYNLTILDLRACHNLEILPDEIGLLKSLIYLDISECYLLDEMPKALALLLELQVLKGFVIGDPGSKRPCTLEDLVSLKKLRKLSISTGWDTFPVDKELTAFRQLEVLQNLAIAWGAKRDNDAIVNKEDGETKSTEGGTPNVDNSKEKNKQDNVEQGKQTPKRAPSKIFRTLTSLRKTTKPPVTPELPMSLKKLDIQCFPRTTTPNWLMPAKLPNLEKLYIRGGKLSDIGQTSIGASWKVETLRLKYLREMKMDWRELQTLFPNLIYLENVKCPNLVLFPCDDNGVWLKEK